MNLNISPYQGPNRPKVQLPDREFLKTLGEEGLRKLIGDHYNLLRQSKISNLFPETDEEFEKAKLRSSDFFIQVMGGHPYFNENRGKPMLTRRHAPFKITAEARIVWLECYREVLLKLGISEELVLSYWYYLDNFSMWMVNATDETTEGLQIDLSMQ